LKTLRGELPESLSRFFRNGVDRHLTGGRDGSLDPEEYLPGGSRRKVAAA
jgi:hypothetical protein